MQTKLTKENDKNSNQEILPKTEVFEKIGLTKEEIVQDANKIERKKRIKEEKEKIETVAQKKPKFSDKITIQCKKVSELYSKISTWGRGEFAVVLNSLLHFITAAIIIFALVYAMTTVIRLPLQWYSPLICLVIAIVAAYINEKS